MNSISIIDKDLNKIKINLQEKLKKRVVLEFHISEVSETPSRIGKIELVDSSLFYFCISIELGL